MGKVSVAGHRGGRPTVLVAWLLIGVALTFARDAFAQDAIPSCSAPIGRLVSIQGTVELQRAGSPDWLPITRLDTALCAGDRLRTDALSRAALFVQPETLVRVDQNTAIRVNQSTDEVEVEFFAAELIQRARPAQSCGAGYFISRFPRKFKVTTPHMNAAVEGTEFMVESSCDATKLTVLEGKVASRSLSTGDTRLVEAGRSVQSGAAGSGAITTVVRPQDAVQWVLRYPPISDESGGATLSGAEALLRAGGIEEALAAIDATLARDPSNSDALALRSVIQVAKNDKAGALASARRATELAAANYRAWLALSYAQQAGFDLDAALASARHAQELKGDSALTHARVAELLLSNGDVRRAEAAARAAVASDPAESHAHSMLGFVHLARIDTKAARADFRAAIDRDSFAALPRLGLGLAMIREGELASGREQIEIAVALDPSSSLLRSYVGKAYYEENTKARDGLAATQFSLAKLIDPNDPTPWFYDAILMQAQNKPVGALSDLTTSIEKNDQRAVYRSRLLVDDDAASRTASIAAVYRDLGFERVAVLESARALSENAGNYSAHLQLADTYSGVPRHDVTRVSEALQAQIRQPVSISTVDPQLGTDNLAISRDAGPSRSGTNEFNPLFSRNDIRVVVTGLTGGLDTWGDQFVGSALHDKFSYTIAQLHYETDGFTANDAVDRDIYELLVHGQVFQTGTLQLDVKRSEVSVGETFLPFDEEPTPTTIRERSDTVRLSGHHQPSAGDDWIWSVATEDRSRAVASFPDGEIFSNSNSKPYAAEVQYLGHYGAFQVVTGAGHFSEDENYPVEGATLSNESSNVYVYAQWSSAGNSLDVIAGLAGEWFRSTNRSEFSPDTDELDRSQASPKFGIVWLPRAGTTVRAAATSSLHRPFIRSQTIEPTQVAGFNQFFGGFERFYGDFIGTSSNRVGLAVDQEIGEEAFAGLEISGRQLEVPSFVFDRDFTWRERAAHAYLYKVFQVIPGFADAAGWQGALSIDGDYERIERPQALTGMEGIVKLETISAPIGFRLFNSSGFAAKLVTTFVDQEGQFSVDVGFPVVDKQEQAWITDLSVSYSLARRRGEFTIGVRNLFDESLDLVEIDPVNPWVATKQFVFGRFSVAFN